MVHVGTLTLGECMPLALQASAHLSASIGLVLPNLKARLAGILEAQVQLALTPPSFAASLDVALDLVSNLEAAIALGLPGIDFQFAALAELLAEIQADLGALSISLDFGADFALVLGAIGIDFYAYGGRIDRIGPALDAALASGLPGGGGPADDCNAVVLAAASPAAVAALRTLFRMVA